MIVDSLANAAANVLLVGAAFILLTGALGVKPGRRRRRCARS